MNRSRRKVDKKQIIVWLVTVAISIIYIVFGNKYMSQDLDIMNMGTATIKARVVSLEDFVSETMEAGAEYTNYTQYFIAEVLQGEKKGEYLICTQSSDDYSGMNDHPVRVRDKVILYNLGTEEEPEWIFGSYSRLDTMVVFGLIFFALLIVFGHMKGVNTIISLAFTCLAVFMVFIPAVLKGENVYLWSIITCIFTIVMTLLLTNGASYKSYTTMLGCIFGVALAAILTVFFNKFMRLTGILDEHSIYLQMLGSGVQIDLVSLIFAMVVVGAMGAVMDVAMDISSSLYEIQRHALGITFKELFMSGLRIGRDIMGTMANTLVLAYIGSSLCGVLLYISYSSSLIELLNRENIIVEIMNSLIGSSSILLTIPLTAIICGLFYTSRGVAQHRRSIEIEENKSAEESILEELRAAGRVPGVMTNRNTYYYTGKNEKK